MKDSKTGAVVATETMLPYFAERNYMNHTSEVGKTNGSLKELNSEVGRETQEHERNKQTKKKE